MVKHGSERHGDAVEIRLVASGGGGDVVVQIVITPITFPSFYPTSADFKFEFWPCGVETKGLFAMLSVQKAQSVSNH